MTTLIILAMVFVFVALRLWSVLGRRTGHEQPLAKPERLPLARAAVPTVGSESGAPAQVEQNASAAAAGGLRAISNADPQFDVARFVDGAKGAYRMVLEAFWRGDEEALAKLADPEVVDAFRHAIAERKAAGETLDNRLIAIETAQIDDARLENGTAYVRVNFEADVAAVTRDAEGQVVAGSLTDAITSHDVWTFRRVVRSPDPNWTLAETDEAA